jgi:hypothetical protein
LVGQNAFVRADPETTVCPWDLVVRETEGPTFRRIERRDGDSWVFVSEAGLSGQDRGSEEI